MEPAADDCMVRVTCRGEHRSIRFQALSTDTERREQISIENGIVSFRSRNVDGVEDGSEVRQDVMRRDGSSRMVIICDLSQLQHRDATADVCS